MKDTEIIEQLIGKLSLPVGRHLYGVLGSYESLGAFSDKLQEARAPDGRSFPKPRSVNRGILDAIPDDEFRQLVADEAKYPEPTAAHVGKAFEAFLRSLLKSESLAVLTNLELLFAYAVDLSLLRVLATDSNRIILLLPARREQGSIVMFPGCSEITYMLPINLIADNHLWQISDNVLMGAE